MQQNTGSHHRLPSRSLQSFVKMRVPGVARLSKPQANPGRDMQGPGDIHLPFLSHTHVCVYVRAHTSVQTDTRTANTYPELYVQAPSV